MTFSSLVVLFALCSFAGWVFESVHSVIRTGKWDRRGFLYGPICPIYGVGVVGITLVATAITDMVGAPLTWWQVFLVSFFGRTGKGCRACSLAREAQEVGMACGRPICNRGDAILRRMPVSMNCERERRARRT